MMKSEILDRASKIDNQRAKKEKDALKSALALVDKKVNKNLKSNKGKF